ncbi:hypothetical protein H0H87_010966 [Tephrocybe sp. NHM501043]|nr:hypothetical protein H0H87_010966 [Tephrocybe sp. NHM501043]
MGDLGSYEQMDNLESPTHTYPGAASAEVAQTNSCEFYYGGYEGSMDRPLWSINDA